MPNSTRRQVQFAADHEAVAEIKIVKDEIDDEIMVISNDVVKPADKASAKRCEPQPAIASNTQPQQLSSHATTPTQNTGAKKLPQQWHGAREPVELNSDSTVAAANKPSSSSTREQIMFRPSPSHRLLKRPISFESPISRYNKNSRDGTCLADKTAQQATDQRREIEKQSPCRRRQPQRTARNRRRNGELRKRIASKTNEKIKALAEKVALWQVKYEQQHKGTSPNRALTGKKFDIRGRTLVQVFQRLRTASATAAIKLSGKSVAALVVAGMVAEEAESDADKNSASSLSS